METPGRFRYDWQNVREFSDGCSILTYHWRARVFCVLALCAGAVLAANPARAEDRTFLGQTVRAQEGVYLVTKGANVRAGPKTGAKKLGTVKAGTRVRVVGRAKGGAGWMAITRDGKDYGFVYAPILLPMIDGTLEEPLSGRIVVKGRAPCRYSIDFQGRNTVDGEDYSYADYDVHFRCRHKGKTFAFWAPMFMSEVPYRLTHKPVFQITIDLPEVENGLDEVFSTGFDYLRDKGKVVLEGVSIKSLGRKAEVTEKDAAGIAQALTAAVEMAPGAWGDGVWKQLREADPDGDY